MMAAASNSFVARLRPLRLPRVCVAVIGSDPAEMLDKAEALVRDNTFLEFRLDYLPRPALALPKIKQFAEYHSHVVAMATCRRVADWGQVSRVDRLPVGHSEQGFRFRMPVSRSRTAECDPL